VSPDEARARFAGARVARLATTSAHGRPHIVPIVFAVDGEHVYSAVDQKPKRTTKLRRLENIAANPHVSLLVDHYEDDWDKLWWVRADGLARLLDADHDDEARNAIELLRARYPQQRATGSVLAVAIARWIGWSGSRLD
jgi:PPOX class probable F420-dependent enzyme